MKIIKNHYIKAQKKKRKNQQKILLNIKIDDWLSKFEQLILNNFNNYEEKINNYKKDLDDVNFEITKLKIELAKEQRNNIILNNQIKDKTVKLEELESLLKDKDSLIKAQEERISLQIKDKEKLELSLNDNIVKYKLKEEENEVLLDVFFSVISKKKEKYELFIKKLSSNLRQYIKDLNKQYNFFK